MTKGLGMGLSIVEAMVRKDEGYITIESAPQQGTAVSIFLPAALGHRLEPTYLDVYDSPLCRQAQSQG